MVILYMRHLNLCEKSFMMIVQKRKGFLSLKSIFLTFLESILLKTCLYGIMYSLRVARLEEKLFVRTKV